MPQLELIPASRVSPEDRAALLNVAYVDYFVPMRLTPDGMRSVDHLYDVDLSRSVVARMDERLVGMALLSIRGDRGWVSGVGVLPEWRRGGTAKTMMAALLSAAREAGLAHVTLEVITQNAAARALYASLGFVERRELLCWRRAADADALPIPEELLQEAPAIELLEHCDAWHDQPACWQGEVETLRKMADRVRGSRLALDAGEAAYCLISHRGDTLALMDVGINPQFGPVNAGRTLLQTLVAQHRGLALALNNVPADSGLNRALAALRFLVGVRQIEMRRDLSS